MKKDKIIELVSLFKDRRIAVLGDLMLDVYVWGSASRISPEAPVPVVQIKRKTCCLGGAANVMRNAVTLGGKVAAFGIIGEDGNGEAVRNLLAEYEIADDYIYSDKQRKTTEKQRVIAGSQQLLRIDYEDVSHVNDEIRRQIIADMLQLVNDRAIDAIIFEDYGKGLLEERMLQTICDAAKQQGIITALDPKPGHLMKVNGLSVIKPNRKEAFAMAGCFDNADGIPVEEDQGLKDVAAKLLKDWEPEYLLISLAAQGMALFAHDGSLKVIPTVAREVYDVSGAGDTVIAAFTLALASGASAAEAAEIANHAAGIVVGKVGTVTVSAEELINSFNNGK